MKKHIRIYLLHERILLCLALRLHSNVVGSAVALRFAHALHMRSVLLALHLRIIDLLRLVNEIAAHLECFIAIDAVIDSVETTALRPVLVHFLLLQRVAALITAERHHRAPPARTYP